MGIKHAHQTALPDDPTKDVSATNWNADHTITLTKAELNAAVSDGNVQFVGDAPTAHTHPSTEVTGLGTLATQSGTFSGTSSGTNSGDETAAGILAKLLTVDGAGSGLDADMLDGLSAAAFATAAQGTLAASASQPGHTHTASNITDFATAVAATAAVTANTAKVSNATHTGDVTGATALTIAARAVTWAKTQAVATARLLGRVTGGSGDVEELTGTQVTAMLDTVTSGAKGLAPASGGGTVNYLRADGTWAAPAAAEDIPPVLELYAENPSSPVAPSATGTNAVAIGYNATVSGDYANAFGDATASGNYSVSIGYFSTSSGLSSLALGSAANSSSARSVAIGSNSGGYGSTTAVGTSAMALGGSYASGTDSFAAAIANNTSSYGATGANSVAMGDRVKVTANSSSSVGRLNTVSGPNGASAIGQSLTVSGEGAFASGQTCFASGTYSQAFGNGASTASIYGKLAKSSGFFSSFADMQTGILILVAATTDATPKTLTSNKTAASTTNQIILPNNSAYAFHGTIVARQQASQGTACAAWKIEGLIRREGSAGTTVLVNSATTVLDNTPSWGMTLSADTTNGGLKIEVTGAAATNIRFVATVHTSECTF